MISYFGTLFGLCNIHDLPYSETDFRRSSVDGHAHVSALCLVDYLAAWSITASNKCKTVLEDLKQNALNPANMYRWTRSGMDWSGTEQQAAECALTTLKRLECAGQCLLWLQTAERAVDERVIDSTILLCVAILNTAYYLYRSMEVPSVVHAMSAVRATFQKLHMNTAQRLFDAHDWCPREAKVIKDLLDHDPHSVLYLSQLDRSGQLGEHASCDDSMCRAHQINNSLYRTRHVDSRCDCTFLDVTNECRQNVLETLIEPKRLFRKIQLPKTSWMITFVDGVIKPVFVSPYKVEATRTLGKVSDLLAGPQMTYCVAVSHVWSDGLGNAERNALPECQVGRLQVLVNRLFPPEYWPVPFWVDTHCIPATDEQARRMAIGNMEHVYKTATKILVLDASLYDISTEGMSDEEVSEFELTCPRSVRGET